VEKIKDNEKTLGLWAGDLVDDLPGLAGMFGDLGLLNVRFLDKLRYRINRRICDHRWVLRRILEVRKRIKTMHGVKSSEGSVVFLLRVDDFPRWDLGFEDYMEFHSLLESNKIPYLLGVTPKLSKNPLKSGESGRRELTSEELSFLQKVSRSGVDLALHGLTHQRNDRGSELFVSGDKLNDIIVEGLGMLEDNGLKAPFFIPPFNKFDYNTLGVLKSHFKVVCGGAESIEYVGYRTSPSYLDGVLYVPSYWPAYGRANEVVEFVKGINVKENIFVPLTLHWSWERENNFRDVEVLVNELKGRVMEWKSLL